MIDIKALRANFDEYATALGRRGVALADLEAIVAMDESRRNIMTKEQALRAQRGTYGKKIGQASPEERPALIAESKEVSDAIEALATDLQDLETKTQAALMALPNLPHPDAPDGGEDDAVEIAQFGVKREFDFEPKDHLDLGLALGILDSERAVKIAGSRFAFLLGDAVRLQYALIQHALGIAERHGFNPVIPPVLSREESLIGTGFLPGSEDQLYRIPQDDLYLVGTAEVPLAGMFADEIFEAQDLPLRMAGVSTCFRREAGTYGKDTRGIFRVHQFDKVELFSWVLPEESWDEHVRLKDIQQEVLVGLGLHGRVVDIALGDLGDPAARKYDLEVYLPGQDAYRELTSTSNCTDYQARRLGMRYRTENGTEIIHTLNGTACAVGRTIIAVMETHQQRDGSIALPESIARHMGKDVIQPLK